MRFAILCSVFFIMFPVLSAAEDPDLEVTIRLFELDCADTHLTVQECGKLLEDSQTPSFDWSLENEALDGFTAFRATQAVYLEKLALQDVAIATGERLNVKLLATASKDPFVKLDVEYTLYEGEKVDSSGRTQGVLELNGPPMLAASSLTSRKIKTATGQQSVGAIQVVVIDVRSFEF